MIVKLKKILGALRVNSSPLPEFETDEAHVYFVTRIFIHENFYEDGVENGVEDGVENELSTPKLSSKEIQN